VVQPLVQGWPENNETRMAMRVERHRYRDSNPGFRTENMPVRLRLSAADWAFGSRPPFLAGKGPTRLRLSASRVLPSALPSLPRP
jgi:hypothetical protein